MIVSTETTAALTDVLIVEIGERVGAGACGSLLVQLGADVVLVEPAHASSRWKWRNRAAMAVGKRSIRMAGDDDQLLRALLERADVVLLSSDVTGVPAWQRRARQIVCDVTAFGNSGPLRGLPYTDALVQAISGVADTTGEPAGPPTLVGWPVLEFSAGIYAASGVIAGLRVRARSGLGQDLDVALFDCAVSMLATFLPFPISGKAVTRAGNKHSLASPWNAYRAADGWILICTATDDQWGRLCKAIGQPQRVRQDGYATNSERVANASRVDAAVEEWTRDRTVEECLKSLGETGIACGPILTVSQLYTHDNLLHRQMIVRARDEATGHEVPLPGSPLKAAKTPGRTTLFIPAPDGDRAALAAMLSRPRAADPDGTRATHEAGAGPYAGLRVVEIGQYTTAPLVARQLAALGAEVIKVEPPGGEGSRQWPPHQGEQGYFFTFSNSDKRSVVLDLRNAEDNLRFRALLQTADVLVENLKSGALARLGLDAAQLARINPGLVYCAISGFGLDSKYPGRPAFDTVVQAMCGFMDLTRANGTPMKSGISAADIMGGELALLAIAAALAYRDRSGVGQGIDISMQDAGVWATQMEWQPSPAGARSAIVACNDGYLAVDGDAERLAQWLSEHGRDPRGGVKGTISREELSASAKRACLITAPVQTVQDVLNHPQVAARQLVIYGTSEDGLEWPLLNSPLRLSRTPPAVRRPIGKLGEANDEILGRLDAAIASLTKAAAR